MAEDYDYRISDKGVAMWGPHKMEKVDVPTFQRLNDTWAMDKKHVYSFGKKMSKADRASFHVLNHLYAKDDQHAYYLGGVIKEADAGTFTALDPGVFSTDIFNGFKDKIRTDVWHAGFAADSSNVFHYVMTFGKPCVIRGISLPANSR